MVFIRDLAERLFKKHWTKIKSNETTWEEILSKDIKPSLHADYRIELAKIEKRRRFQEAVLHAPIEIIDNTSRFNDRYKAGQHFGDYEIGTPF